MKRRKFLPPDAIRAEEVLEILGFRGWENPAKESHRRTGWAPSTESLGFLGLRPLPGRQAGAAGEEIFSLLAGDREAMEILFYEATPWWAQA